MHEALLRQYNLNEHFKSPNHAVNRFEIAANGRIEQDWVEWIPRNFVHDPTRAASRMKLHACSSCVQTNHRLAFFLTNIWVTEDDSPNVNIVLL